MVVMVVVVVLGGGSRRDSGLVESGGARSPGQALHLRWSSPKHGTDGGTGQPCDASRGQPWLGSSDTNLQGGEGGVWSLSGGVGGGGRVDWGVDETTDGTYDDGKGTGIYEVESATSTNVKE
eukprot:GFKZ01001164.1.p3 GENE.GFKZ01001164.1~~GFKZ01001164.1.p3  ORF type:complete len:122 (-),score=9.56 GFKZ01001164.1:272-637(-)